MRRLGRRRNGARRHGPRSAVGRKWRRHAGWTGDKQNESRRAAEADGTRRVGPLGGYPGVAAGTAVVQAQLKAGGLPPHPRRRAARPPPLREATAR